MILALFASLAMLGNATLGVGSTQVNQPRLLQLSLRLQW